MSVRRNMPRWTRDPVWIPERFRQNAVNSYPRRPPTPYEQSRQWIRMYMNRKITAEALRSFLQTLREENPEDVAVQGSAMEACKILEELNNGDIEEGPARDFLQGTMNTNWEQSQP